MSSVRTIALLAARPLASRSAFLAATPRFVVTPTRGNASSTTSQGGKTFPQVDQAKESVRARKPVENLIVNDHRSFEELYERYNGTKGTSPAAIETKQAIVNEFVREVAQHSVAEETVVYSLIDKLVDEKVGDQLRHDHLKVKEALFKLDKIKVGDQGFDELFAKIVSLLKTHAKEEETRQLPALRAKIPSEKERIDLSAKFLRAKVISPTRPHPNAPDKPAALEVLARDFLDARDLAAMMQEVTIRQRSAFKHFVTVDQAGKELCWNFFTRKKNISFGLYKKINRPYPDDSIVPGDVAKGFQHLAEDERTSTPGSPKLPARSRGNSTGGASGQPGTPDTIDPPSLLRDTASSKSFVDSELSGTLRRRRKEPFVDPELAEIMPVTHYESSKFTVKGSYFVEEPGSYVLLWDNSFSVNTSKKLFFTVALKDVAPSQIPTRNEFENWMLKKGDKKLQGFQKRWVTVDSNGVFSYYKSPGSFCRNSVELGKATVHLEHSGEQQFFFKAPSAQEYLSFLQVLKRFTQAKSMHSFRLDEEDDESGPNKLIPDDDKWSGSKGGLDPDLVEVQKQAENMVITLTNELGRLRDAVESSRGGRNQVKDMNNVLNSITDVIANALANANGMQRQLTAYGETVRLQRERSHDATQQSEAAFQACLADNNRVRRRFGLEPVTMASFLMTASTMSLNKPQVRKAGSMSSSLRDDEFFDAEEGGKDSDDDDDSDTDSMHEAEAIMSSDDEDNITEEEQSRKGSMSSDSKVDTTKVDGAPALPVRPKPLVRRIRLPAPTISMQNISVMSLIRNNAGKDLSTVAMPIALNEPLNLLQKLCEELEYCELLEQAAATPDPVNRISIVAAFAVSAYASTVHRAGRKPFNPLLGETYECIRDDKGFKFVSEKVSHHPPVMACYAEAPNYRFYQDNQVKTKFWGKSMELIPSGTVHVEFPALKEHYTWTKVTTCMRNVFSNSRYLEHYGTMKIVSQSTGHTCELSFKESGYFSSTKNEISGTIIGPNGQKLMSLSGNWDKSLQRFQDSAPNALEVIWRARPNPAHQAEIYGFTSFAVELNELTPDLEGLLPETDTRYRPDQRMYEEGRADEAEAEKQRLEQKQRNYRKELEMAGKSWTPQWFTPAAGAADQWKYKGGYWEKRGRFEKVIDLWGN
ncbi:Oxysterol-binding protein- protein 3 [Geranomyces michiganensis]|nr:Oxysterol-binding protein- protein 3 [Geranomyces michiganensis]